VAIGRPPVRLFFSNFVHTFISGNQLTSAINSHTSLEKLLLFVGFICLIISTTICGPAVDGRVSLSQCFMSRCLLSCPLLPESSLSTSFIAFNLTSPLFVFSSQILCPEDTSDATTKLGAVTDPIKEHAG
jgi:hypothetical protein